MNMFWDGKRFVNNEWGNGAFVHMLRATAIAALVSSCSTMKAQSEADIPDAAISPANAEEPPDAPRVELLPTSVLDEIRKHLDGFGIEPERLNNVYATISYKDEDDKERLLSLVTNTVVYEKSQKQNPVDVSLFLIPEEGDGRTNFTEAIVVYTGSPDAQSSCGGSSNGGSRYCRP